MASGHVNRINRPNTWLHRPMLRREVLTCQPRGVQCRYSRVPIPGGGRPAQPSQIRRSGAQDGSSECDHRGGTRRTACPALASADPSSPGAPSPISSANGLTVRRHSQRLYRQHRSVADLSNVHLDVRQAPTAEGQPACVWVEKGHLFSVVTDSEDFPRSIDFAPAR